MSTRIITLCYRKIIYVNAAKQWDKLVFEASYIEFKMQAQNYSSGTTFTSYADLLRHVNNAQAIVGMVMPAISGYVQQLGNIVPDILNNVGKRFLKFNRFQFEIINSDILDKTKHQVAVNFYTEPLLWHDTVDNFLLVSDQKPTATADEEQLSNLFQLQPYVNIHSIKIFNKMEKLSPGQIFLADQRGVVENEISRRFSSFNYGHYVNESRKPFGPLEVFNDEILAAGKSVNVTVQNACYLVVIPITGALLTADARNKTTVTDVGEVFIHYAVAGEAFELTNPYPNNWVNFLLIRVKAKTDAFPFFEQTFNFDFAGKQNRLIDVIPDYSNLPFSIHIGQFAGRSDVLYHLKNSDSLFYAFAIAGAFELQGRLLHERDGLALWDLQEADMEALSNNAVMLVIEMTG